METLINEEALVLAKYLRDERKSWVPRISILCVNSNANPCSFKESFRKILFNIRVEVCTERSQYSNRLLSNTLR